MKEEQLRAAFPELEKQKNAKKKSEEDESEKSEIDLKWFFFVVVIGAGLFAGTSSYFKSKPVPHERPRHLRGTPYPTATPDRIPHGYKLNI